MHSKPQIIIIGAGHNGLTCAAYLAKAGFRVLILESRHLVGGACVTEELWPGYKISRGSYVYGLFREKVLRELNLKLPLITRKPSSFTPDGTGGLLLGLNKTHDFEQISKYSKSDAKKYFEFETILGKMIKIIDPMLDIDIADMNFTNKLQLSKSVFSFLRLSTKEQNFMISLLLGSAKNMLSNQFESEILRTTLATDSLIGSNTGPSTPGSGYVLLHHVMGGTSWSYVQGGMGTITQHLKNVAESYGVKILLNSQVKQIHVSNMKQAGGTVTLENGQSYEFSHGVVSNLDPLKTMKMLSSNNEEEDYDENIKQYRKQVANIDFSSPVMKINLALNSLPTFPKDGVIEENVLSPKHYGTIHLGASTLKELDDSFLSSQMNEFPKKPMIELTIPSTLDSTLVEKQNHHVCSLFIQHVPCNMDANFWNKHRESFADKVIQEIEHLSPNFSSRIVHRDILSPVDLERVFNLTGGNIFHGSMSMDRLLQLRPVDTSPVGSSYATPFKNVFMCSAGTHPGGGVMAAAGRNAALAILKRIKL